MFAVMYENSAWTLMVSARQSLACPDAPEIPTPSAQQVDYLRAAASALLKPVVGSDVSPPTAPAHPVIRLTEATLSRRKGNPATSASLSPGDGSPPPWLESLLVCERAEGLRLSGEYADATAVITSAITRDTPICALEAFCRMSLMRRHALVLRSTGEYDAAAKVCADITILVRGFPSLRTSAEYAKHVAATAELVRSTGRPEAALRAARRAYRALTEALGGGHPDTISQLGNVGETLRALGRTRAAVRAYGACVNGLLETLGPDHPEVGKRLLNLSHGYRQAGDIRAARICALYGRCILRDAYGDGHHHVAKADAAVAGLGLATNLSDSVTGLRVRVARLPTSHHHVPRSLRQVAAILRDGGYSAAAAYVERGAAELEQVQPREDPTYGAIRVP